MPPRHAQTRATPACGIIRLMQPREPFINKFLITGVLALAVAAGMTLYFRQRSPHRSGTWTIRPGCGEFYALHASGSSQFLVKLRPASTAPYALAPINAAARAQITFPVQTTPELPFTRRLHGPFCDVLEFNPSPDYLFLYNPGPGPLTVAYDIEKVSG
jgi:hypothetical protein